MKIPDNLFEKLSSSGFRSSFRLGRKEASYLEDKGLEVVMQHAEAFLDERIAPGEIFNDGRQTPMRNHPVFVAQHAAAVCCRKCIEKWHGIRKGHTLTKEERKYLLEVIRIWLLNNYPEKPRSSRK